MWVLFGTELGGCKAKGISQCVLNTDSVPSIMPGTVDEQKTYHARLLPVTQPRSGWDTHGNLPRQSFLQEESGHQAGCSAGRRAQERTGRGSNGWTQAHPGLHAAVCLWASHPNSLSLHGLLSTLEVGTMNFPIL